MSSSKPYNENVLPTQIKSEWFQARLEQALVDGDKLIWTAEGCGAIGMHVLRYIFNLVGGMAISVYVSVYALPAILSAHFIPATAGAVLLAACWLLLVSVPLMMMARRNRFAYAISEKHIFVANDWAWMPSFERLPLERIRYVRMMGDPENGSVILFDYSMMTFPFQTIGRLWLPLNRLSGIPDPASVQAMIQSRFVKLKR